MDRSLIVTSIIDDRDHPILRSLCEVTNSVIADGSGIGWTEPFDDPIALLPYFSERASAANVSLVVAHTQDNVALGSVQLCDNKEKFRCEACAHRAEISCFFVSKSVRGKGVGFELLTKAQDAAKEIGVSKITLDCRETQTDAIKLYERFGMNRYGVMANYASLDGKDFFRGFYYDKEI